MLLPVGVDADREVGGLVLHDLVVPDLDHDRVQEHHRVDRVQRPGLPGADLLQHLVGDPRDRLVGQLGAVDLLQVVQDVPHGHAVRVQADDHVVQAAGDPPGPLGHQQRLERAGPVPRHGQRHRPDPGLHRLGDGAVAVVTVAAAAGPVVPLIAQVRGQLGLQRPLQHRPHQLAEHRALAGQPQPAGLVPRPFQQRVQQPVIHQLPQRHPRRVLPGPGRAARTRASPAPVHVIPGHPRHRAVIARRRI